MNKIGNSCLRDNVLCDLGGHVFEWARVGLANRYVGKTVDRLVVWKGDDIYVRDVAIIACHLIANVTDKKPLLPWTESESD